MYFPVSQDRQVAELCSKVTETTIISEYISELTTIHLDSCGTDSSCETSSANSSEGEFPKKAKSGMLKKLNKYIKNAFNLKL